QPGDQLSIHPEFSMTVDTEIQRRVRQQGADIDSLYELVTVLGENVDAGFAAAAARDDILDTKVDQLGAKLDQILQRLGGTS
ncbi:hypothetical protein, partial [uncultured Pseudonocardia sp.]|uniref:hypothetical protein n=1 Tax=uncultured Pseudonocardia sp. TaxID=211455 RepID=UPI00263A19A1